MNWAEEIGNSLRWLSIAFVVSSIAFFAIAFLLKRYTQWGRDFATITWNYFSLSRNKMPFLFLLVIILLAMASVRLNVVFTYWYNDFYTSMQDLNADAFWAAILLFGVLATIHVLRALFNYYIRQYLLIDWRNWLTQDLLAKWLNKQGYYRSHFIKESQDNPDQRIQQDIAQFVSLSLSLSMGLLEAMVSLIEFTLLLWTLSATLAIFGVEIPRAMIFLAYIYVIIATVFAFKIGRPLIKLNFINEKTNADFRYALIRLREYGENIAFYVGEKVEAVAIKSRFSKVIKNSWDLVYRSLKFDGFNLAVNQIAVIFPIVIQAPRLFAKEIKLGEVMQTVSAFREVQEALSFFRMSYDTFANYRAVQTRLIGLIHDIDTADHLPKPETQYHGSALVLKELQVLSANNQQPLFPAINLQLEKGQSLLITGPSGVGKTTLLRSLAGLWPFVGGSVTFPENTRHFFLPQRPYLPLGSLRTALAYPELDADKDACISVLQKVQLAHLIDRLDEDADWTRILSLGEQQRLAIARLLLVKPDIVFMDEASSAMDEGLEYTIYSLIKQELPNLILVSVGHRAALKNFHQFGLEIHQNKIDFKTLS
jgi:putative ATP-binding cassette transporter